MLMYRKLATTDDDPLANYVVPYGYTYTRDVNSDGTFEYSVEKFPLQKCLDLYGGNPELEGYFQDVYEN